MQNVVHKLNVQFKVFSALTYLSQLQFYAELLLLLLYVYHYYYYLLYVLLFPLWHDVAGNTMVPGLILSTGCRQCGVSVNVCAHVHFLQNLWLPHKNADEGIGYSNYLLKSPGSTATPTRINKLLKIHE